MADYNGYLNSFNGSLIGSESEFDNVLLRSQTLLESFTEGRINDYDGSAKDTALYVMCERIYSSTAQQKADTVHAGLASENTDGYSVSYKSSGTDVFSADNQRSLYYIARTYLPTELFYRGIL